MLEYSDQLLISISGAQRKRADERWRKCCSQKGAGEAVVGLFCTEDNYSSQI
jgi:hypothetical protein